METAAHKISEIASLIDCLTEDERAEINELLSSNTPIWVPQPGPQTDAYQSPADILYYGGSAGGGKTDLLLGLALTSHRISMLFRREGVQNISMINRLLDEILHSRRHWNGQKATWQNGGHQIRFHSCKDAGDEIKFQGHNSDLKGFDEITHFLESQFRFLCGWLRDAQNPAQRTRIVCTGNPPTNEEGQWVTRYWGAWLDKSHPHPAEPGELRWYTTIGGKDVECKDGSPFRRDGEIIQPLSRTFIPSKVQDNVFLMATGYQSILQALPEPLRSQMLHGDFTAGVEDSVWQVIPTAWVEAAMARWEPEGKTKIHEGRIEPDMTSCGLDVARGGSDQTIVSTRYGNWYDRLSVFPGAATPDGASSAGVAISCIRDRAPIHVDIIGIGASTYDHLKSNEVQVIAVNGAGGPEPGALDKATRSLKFRNYRAQIWWQFRETLDPKTGANIALPPDQELKADLCAPTWFLTPQGIQIESKEQIIHGPRLHKTSRALGRSPDKGDAVVYCSINTVKEAVFLDIMRGHEENYDPLTFGLNDEQGPDEDNPFRIG